MADQTPSTAAGGFPIAMGALGGAVIGFLLGQPTIGFFVGVAAGCVVAAVLWRSGGR